jgi:hypothetical protein
VGNTFVAPALPLLPLEVVMGGVVMMLTAPGISVLLGWTALLLLWPLAWDAACEAYDVCICHWAIRKRF